jgi:hypothetical protein
VRYTVNTLMSFYSNVLSAGDALSTKINPVEMEYVRQHTFMLREAFIQLVLKLNYRYGLFPL